MAATDQQVQTYVNERIRPYAELARSLYILAQDHKAAIDDVYDACEPVENATWQDNRTDGPPHLLTAQDVLAFNAFITDLMAIIENTNLANDAAKAAAVNSVASNWDSLMRACVRVPGV